MYMKNLTSLFASFLIALFVLGSVQTASAATTTEARIAELMAQVAALQAELARLQGDTYTTTVGVTTSGDKVTFKGEVDIDENDDIKAWFEYGYNYALPYSTRMLDLETKGKSLSFSSSVSTLDRNTVYYFRAVVEHDNDIFEGAVRSFTFTGGSSNDNDNDDDDDNDEDAPQVETEDVDDIEENSAELNGSVDMDGYEEGVVFFAYGEDEDAVLDVADEDSYSDIDEDGDDLQVYRLDSDFDGDDDFRYVATGLDDDTEYFYAMCVEFENDDNDEEIVCGDVESFETDN